ncbi:MAG: ExbD/TolR family protein [Burkholderiales bacterium]
MKRRGHGSYFEAERPRVEVIPMIDIMMFLLVFFIVISIRMIAGSGVAMELPGSKSTQDIKTSTLTIGVSKEGQSVVEGKVVKPEELAARLASLSKEQKLDVIIAGDKEASLQTLISVMDVVRGAGITSVGIAARADKAPAPASVTDKNTTDKK